MAADEASNKALVQTAFDAWAGGTGSPFEVPADDGGSKNLRQPRRLHQ
ncbi:hypothetical protein [Rhizobium sp. CBN3]